MYTLVLTWVLWVVRESVDDLLGQTVFLLAQFRQALLVVDDQLLQRDRRPGGVTYIHT